MTARKTSIATRLAGACCAAALLCAPAAAQGQREPTRARAADGVLAEAPVQSQMVRTMIVTCKVEETIKFYRDVLGQTVINDDGGRPVTVAQQLIDMLDTGKIRMVIFGGTGEYPAGPMMGGRIGMLGVLDPKHQHAKR